jgi:hypothetical protein
MPTERPHQEHSSTHSTRDRRRTQRDQQRISRQNHRCDVSHSPM